MNKNKLKYKIGTTEIIALVLLVGVTILLKRCFFGVVIESSVTVEHLLFLSLLSVFSGLFGVLVGCLGGYISIISSYLLCGNAYGFVTAVAIAVFGYMIGRFANVYLVRDGELTTKKIGFYAAMNCIACIVSLVYIMPLLGMVFYDLDLIEVTRKGIVETAFFSVFINPVLTFLMYLINRFFSKGKK